MQAIESLLERIADLESRLEIVIAENVSLRNENTQLKNENAELKILLQQHADAKDYSPGTSENGTTYFRDEVTISSAGMSANQLLLRSSWKEPAFVQNSAIQIDGAKVLQGMLDFRSSLQAEESALDKDVSALLKSKGHLLSQALIQNRTVILFDRFKIGLNGLRQSGFHGFLRVRVIGRVASRFPGAPIISWEGLLVNAVSGILGNRPVEDGY